MSTTLSYTPADTVIAVFADDDLICASCADWLGVDTDGLAAVFASDDADGVACSECDGWINGVAAMQPADVDVEIVDAWGNANTQRITVDVPVLGGWIANSSQIDEWHRECWTAIDAEIEHAGRVSDAWISNVRGTRTSRGYGAAEWTVTVHVGDGLDDADDVAANIDAFIAALVAAA